MSTQSAGNKGSTPASTMVVAARKFAKHYIGPNSAKWERDAETPRDAFLEAARAGLAGVLVPEESGGGGACIRDALPVLEELAAANAAFSFALWVQNNVANAVARDGSADHVERYLPDLLAGKCLGAFCLTEPEKGSDAAAILTHASRDGDSWLLNGTKAWVTNGTHGDLFMVYAQTEPGAGAKGIAAFLVPADVPGVHRGGAYDIPGAAAFGVSDITFKECRLSKGDMLLPPGEGFKAAMTGINKARTFVGALCCGMLSSALEIALKYAAHREAFGKPVLSFQGVQLPLADVSTDLEAARLLTRHAADLLDAGEPAITEAAHSKKFASRAAFNGVSICMQAMGAAGLRSDYPLARHLLAAKMTHFLDGTTEIQNIVIARSLMQQHGLKTE